MTDMTDDAPGTGEELADIIPPAAQPRRRRGRGGQGGERPRPPRGGGGGNGDQPQPLLEAETVLEAPNPVPPSRREPPPEQSTLRLIEEAVPVSSFQPVAPPPPPIPSFQPVAPPP